MKMTNGLLEAIDACATKLEELIHLFPSLASSAMAESLSAWHREKIQLRLQQMGEGGDSGVKAAQNISQLALELLSENGLEETLELLLTRYKIEITPQKLVHLIGRDVYIGVLRNDARLLAGNAISYEQIAALWNGLGRPPLGGHPRWSGRSVSILVE